MLNKVILQGRLTADPELKSTQTGTSVCSFTLAVDRSYGEKKADFINCVAWRNTAEFIAKYFGKGKMLIAVGELQVRQYTTNNGEKRYATEVIVNEANFAGDAAKAQGAEPAAAADDDYGDIPF
jgi:single-strand DNA-binding protein